MNTQSDMRIAQDQIRKAIGRLSVALHTFEVVAEEDPVTCQVELWCDGGAKPNPGEGYGSYAIFKHEGNTYSPVARDTKIFGQDMTNNEAEYDALIWGLKRIVFSWVPGYVNLLVKTDSKLVRSQILGNWRVKAEHLRPLRDEARELLAGFASWRIQHVPRKLVVARLGH